MNLKEIGLSKRNWIDSTGMGIIGESVEPPDPLVMELDKLVY